MPTIKKQKAKLAEGATPKAKGKKPGARKAGGPKAAKAGGPKAKTPPPPDLAKLAQEARKALDALEALPEDPDTFTPHHNKLLADFAAKTRAIAALGAIKHIAESKQAAASALAKLGAEAAPEAAAATSAPAPADAPPQEGLSDKHQKAIQAFVARSAMVQLLAKVKR
jgi:hypothetical protein